MTQYLAHLIMPYYLLAGGYSTDVNDIDECHRIIDTNLTQQVEVREKPDPRLIMYGICLKEYAKHATPNDGLDSSKEDQSHQHKHKTY